MTNKFERLVDLVHLARKTKGDSGLEKEMLDVFERHAAILLEQIKKGQGQAEALALKDCALNIGAFPIIACVEAVEKGENKALERLEVMTKRTNSFIATLKRAA